jgi:hypothetical protein
VVDTIAWALRPVLAWDGGRADWGGCCMAQLAKLNQYTLQLVDAVGVMQWSKLAKVCYIFCI